MDGDEFRRRGKEMVDYVADYLENIRSRKVLPDVYPGYLRPLIPDEAPEEPDTWQEVMQDVDRVIMPGITHWHSPHFHAYFPTGNSYPAICADILSDAIGCIGFTWISSPACTELEVVMLDWLGKLLNLPEEFLACSGGDGGGVIQGTASEATFVALLAAKKLIIKRWKEEDPLCDDHSIGSRLVAYASDQSHSSAERAGLLGQVNIRLLPADENSSLRGYTLQKAIQEDKAKGKIPFLVIATLGTTSSLGFDNLLEIGPISTQEGLWLHVDAAYAGSAFICPEYRYLLDGVEHADSFNFNPHKWMLVNFDCAAMWVKNSRHLTEAFMVDPLYLKHDQQGQVPDYRHWHIPLGRRFRSLKLWFVLRLYGAQKLRDFLRHQIQLAYRFKELVESDERFEIIGEVIMGLVCFRLKGANDENEKLLKAINDGGQIHIVPAMVKEQYILRFAICSRFTTECDIEFAWKEIIRQVMLQKSK